MRIRAALGLVAILSFNGRARSSPQPFSRWSRPRWWRDAGRQEGAARKAAGGLPRRTNSHFNPLTRFHPQGPSALTQWPTSGKVAASEQPLDRGVILVWCAQASGLRHPHIVSMARAADRPLDRPIGPIVPAGSVTGNTNDRPRASGWCSSTNRRNRRDAS